MKAVRIGRFGDPRGRKAEIDLCRCLGAQVHQDAAGRTWAVADCMRAWPVSALAQVSDIQEISDGWRLA